MNTKIKASVKELKKQREIERQIKNGQKGQYNKFVEGTCKFDEKSAQSSGEDDCSKRMVFSKPVDLSVDVMTWKIRMGYLCNVNMVGWLK